MLELRQLKLEYEQKLTEAELDCEHLKSLLQSDSKTLHDTLIAKRNVEKVAKHALETAKR